MRAPVLAFLGGTGTVTGSKFLIEHGGRSVLVDCGLYQGVRQLRDRNWERLPVDAGRIDQVLLTHAHLDHTGYLPVLVARGFAGLVHATHGTSALVPLLLHDAAHVMAEDAEHANARGYSKHHPALPLFTDDQVDQACARLRMSSYDVRTPVAIGTATWRQAGHILGSSTVSLELPTGESLAFSGDLGRANHPLLTPPADPPAVDTLVVESTYGDRTHPPRADVLDVLGATIRRTIARGGSVLVPAFAVDRTEVVLHALHELLAAGAIPDVPVYLDSPMALAVLRIYREAISSGWPGIRAELRGEDVDALDVTKLVELRTADESRGINRPPRPSIVVSASGMATGGRVVHHLEFMLPEHRNTVLLVGHQAEGTRGRALQEGATVLKMHGRYVAVRAEVATIDGLSVHADQDEIVQWLAKAPRPPHTLYVVHGEPPASRALAARVERELGWCAVVPRYGERVRLD